jgi:hypothetical protein
MLTEWQYKPNGSAMIFNNVRQHYFKATIMLEHPAKVTAVFYDLRGKLVAGVGLGTFALGNHCVELDTDR